VIFIFTILLFILIGVALGLAAGFVPGFSSNNLSMLLITYGLISTDYYLAVTAVAIEISFSFFEFLSPIIFGIGNDATALAIDPVHAHLTEESFKRGIFLVATGGLVGIIISLPLIFFAEKIYPLVYDSLKSIVGWILLLLCIYMIWIERGWNKKVFAAIIFILSGLLGLLVKNSGLLSPDYVLLPIFIGLYGFSFIISKKRKEVGLVQDTTWMEKGRAVVIAFITSVFASLIQGMKRGQASALALQIGNISGREEVLFILPAISLAFTTLSIFVLGSVGAIRSSLAYDIQEIMGRLYFSQTLLFAGSVAVSACLSATILILLARPMGRFLSKINERYLKIFGFCIGALLIVNFTGVYGVLLAIVATCIGILSSRFGTRSTHLMGVLLLPSIVTAIL
jgi:putative membrane protein